MGPVVAAALSLCEASLFCSDSCYQNVLRVLVRLPPVLLVRCDFARCAFCREALLVRRP